MDVIQSLGWLATGVTYFTLFGIALSRSDVLRRGWRLAMAFAATAAWALAALYSRSATLMLGLECARDLAWIAVLAERIPGRVFARLSLIAALACVALWVSGGALAWFDYPIVGREVPLALQIHLGLIFALIGLVCVEQAYRSARAAKAHGFTAVLAMLFGYDLLMFSLSEVTSAADGLAGSLRPAVWALASLPIAALSLGREAQPSALAPSQKTVFYTVAMTGVGLYFCAVALGAMALHAAGGVHREWLQFALIIGAVAVVIALLSSREMRAEVRVWIAKHWYRQKYDYRAEWLRFNDTMSTLGASPYATSVRAVATALGSDGGALFVALALGNHFERRGEWHVRANPVMPTPAIDAAMREQLRSGWIIDAEHLISPVLLGDALLGVFVLRHPPAFELSYEDRDLLLVLGRHVGLQIAQYEASQKLAENSQLEAFARMSVFLVHDLKNSAAQLALVVANARKHKANPQFIDDAIRTSDNVVQRIRRVIEHFRPEQEARPLARLWLDEVALAAVAHCADRMPVPRAESMARVQVMGEPGALTAVLEHVIRNAQDATPSTGQVRVGVSARAGVALIVVEDDGHGMSEEFVRDRLFRPFQTTKGAAGMGIGAYQAREHVRAMGGNVEVRSEPGLGTSFCISLPVAPVLEPSLER